MSTNLRLSADAVSALREASRRSGRSQQDLLREAVDQFLGLSRVSGARQLAVASGLVLAPAPFRDTTPDLKLAQGVSTLDLLDRDDTR